MSRRRVRMNRFFQVSFPCEARKALYKTPFGSIIIAAQLVISADVVTGMLESKDAGFIESCRHACE